MNEFELQVFINGAVNYFAQLEGEPARVSTPYLMSSRVSVSKGYTGIIGISGARRGNVYFTAPPVFVKVLLMSLGESDTDQETLCDAVGEVANTISGNARRSFGSEFMISTPIVVAGELNDIVLPQTARSFVIPIAWRSYESALVISLE